jgi:FKBP-type peptidyl-prolyl cis-trans isomerase FkpA
MKKHLILFFSLFVIGLSACQKSDVTTDQAAIDDSKIQAYLKANNLTATKDASGLYYKIVIPGTAGTNPTATTTNVQISYTNIYLNGITFDHVNVIDYKLAALVKGLQIGIPKIGNGGRIVLYVPSALAYGNTDQFTIPANSILVYTVDLIGSHN